VSQQHLAENAARGIAGAEKQDVESARHGDYAAAPFMPQPQADCSRMCWTAPLRP
jgi:hypothetical protein